VLTVKYKLPFSQLTSLDEEEKQRWLKSGEPAEFKSLARRSVGGQLDAGFVLTGLFEDHWSDEARFVQPLFRRSRSPRGRWKAATAR